MQAAVCETAVLQVKAYAAQIWRSTARCMREVAVVIRGRCCCAGGHCDSAGVPLGRRPARDCQLHRGRNGRAHLRGAVERTSLRATAPPPPPSQRPAAYAWLSRPKALKLMHAARSRRLRCATESVLCRYFAPAATFFFHGCDLDSNDWPRACSISTLSLSTGFVHATRRRIIGFGHF